jgi:8-amino-7-oxononanoate synthase
MIAAALAELQGLARATLARSTLHVFWDIFEMIPAEQYCIYIDSEAYPIAYWGAERAAGRGMLVKSFPHRDVNALRTLLRKEKKPLRPVIVTNGICTCCGCTTPLRAYQEYAHESGGLLIIDDTQALGILGYSPSSSQPYGLEGGGSLRHLDLSGESILVICSLAKAFGVPIASLSGSDQMIELYETQSQTRIHCSPPSQADLAAAEHALVLNQIEGDMRRRTLIRLVHLFKSALTAVGLITSGGSFPLQTLRNTGVFDPILVHRRLLARDVQTVLHKYPGQQASISFTLTARHRPENIETVATILMDILQSDLAGQDWRHSHERERTFSN